MFHCSCDGECVAVHAQLPFVAFKGRGLEYKVGTRKMIP
jgi:hypothetical protein